MAVSCDLRGAMAPRVKPVRAAHTDVALKARFEEHVILYRRGTPRCGPEDEMAVDGRAGETKYCPFEVAQEQLYRPFVHIA